MRNVAVWIFIQASGINIIRFVTCSKTVTFSVAWRNVIVQCRGIHWIRKVDILRSGCGSKTVTMTTFLYQWYVSHRSCILVSIYTGLISQRYWGRLERPSVIPSNPAMFSGGVAPGCLLNPGLSKVTARYGLPCAGSPVRKAPGNATLTHGVVWNKQTSK